MSTAEVAAASIVLLDVARSRPAAVRLAMHARVEHPDAGILMLAQVFEHLTPAQLELVRRGGGSYLIGSYVEDVRTVYAGCHACGFVEPRSEAERAGQWSPCWRCGAILAVEVYESHEHAIDGIEGLAA